MTNSGGSKSTEADSSEAASSCCSSVASGSPGGELMGVVPQATMPAKQSALARGMTPHFRSPISDWDVFVAELRIFVAEFRIDARRARVFWFLDIAPPQVVTAPTTVGSITARSR